MEACDGRRFEGGSSLLLNLGNLLGGLRHLTTAVSVFLEDGLAMGAREVELAAGSALVFHPCLVLLDADGVQFVVAPADGDWGPIGAAGVVTQLNFVVTDGERTKLDAGSASLSFFGAK